MSKRNNRKPRQSTDWRIINSNRRQERIKTLLTWLTEHDHCNPVDGSPAAKAREAIRALIAYYVNHVTA